MPSIGSDGVLLIRQSDLTGMRTLGISGLWIYSRTFPCLGWHRPPACDLLSGWTAKDVSMDVCTFGERLHSRVSASSGVSST